MSIQSIEKSELETVVCNLCNQSDFEEIYRIPDYAYHRHDFFSTFVKCKHCGLVYQNPRPTPNKIMSYYPSSYTPHNFYRSADNHGKIYNMLFQYGLRKRCDLVFRYKESGKLLDVGCATGEFLNAVSHSKRWHVKGVEIDEKAAEIARQKYQLNVVAGTIFSNEITKDSYDVITFWEVIEHLHNPAEVLHKAFTLTNPGGILIVRLPNFASFDKSIFGKYWAGFDAPRHLYIFSPTTIKKMIEKAGYKILEINCRSGGYTSFLISINYWLKGICLNDTARHLVLSLLGHPITRIFAAPPFFVSGLLRKGATLILVAKKNPENTDG